jgi:hypothetical protein
MVAAADAAGIAVVGSCAESCVDGEG